MKKKRATLFYKEHYTMASNWETEIFVNSTTGGGCILMAHIHCNDLEDIGPSRYRSAIIKTAKGFEKSWAKCCEALDEHDVLEYPDIDEDVIALVKKISPLVAKDLKPSWEE